MPRTEAGKRLQEVLRRDSHWAFDETIDAIEAEAFAAGDAQGWDAGITAERERISTAVELWESPWLSRVEVLDIIYKVE